jgi:hypothetical protein
VYGGDDVSHQAWLQCEVKPGMFEDEVAICITTTDGNVLSFFIPSDFVRSFGGRPEEKAIPVDVVDRNSQVGVVSLPRRSFEGSTVATVPAHALRFA